MCGVNDAVCLHGDCVVEAEDGAAYECCRCYAMYDGAQCSFRKEMLYWELPVACALMLILLGVGAFVTGRVIAWLRFSQAKQDTFAFPRQWETLADQSFGSRLLPGKWSGPTRKGLPTKPAKHHIVENIFVVIAVFMELVPWVQLTALSFLPVVPWPKSSRGVAEILRLSLLYPLWSHLEPSQFPRFMLYLSLGFVPGVLLVSIILGVKRFPLFKPQPKNAPAEDVCTLVLRLYSEWLALPVMIGLLLPLECAVIGYRKTDGSKLTLPTLETSCFTFLQGGFVVAGSFVLVGYCITSSIITIQLNCEASPPQPTLWTHVRYTRAAQMFKAPVAMVSLKYAQYFADLMCVQTNAWHHEREDKTVHAFVGGNPHPGKVNGLRLAGAIMALWTSSLALVVAIIDDPGAAILYEAWSLGAIAISAISLPGLFIYHTEDFWHRLASAAKKAGSSSLAATAKDAKGAKSGKVADSTPAVAIPPKTQAGKVTAIGYRGGLPKIAPRRRSSAAEKLRSRSKRFGARHLAENAAPWPRSARHRPRPNLRAVAWHLPGRVQAERGVALADYEPQAAWENVSKTCETKSTSKFDGRILHDRGSGASTCSVAAHVVAKRAQLARRVAHEENGLANYDNARRSLNFEAMVLAMAARPMAMQAIHLKPQLDARALQSTCRRAIGRGLEGARTRLGALIDGASVVVGATYNRPASPKQGDQNPRPNMPGAAAKCSA
ncbi:hypothetical protein ON010_g10302 [Phytophthora cinnamomi]|nr:hypothetical protein ON010_g10302 [Phytophthora cinnamomi]